VSLICQGLGLLFAFVMLAPHADVHYERPPAAWSSR
jgi:hypothetical protein